MYILIGADNHALARMQEDLVLGVRTAGNLNQPLIHNDLCVADSVHRNAELRTANGYRCSGAVDSIGVWFSAKVVNLYTHLSEQNVEQLAKGVGCSKVFEHNAGARTHHDEAAVGQLYGGMTSSSCVDLFAGGEHVPALCGGRSLRAVRQQNSTADAGDASLDQRHLCSHMSRTYQRQRNEKQSMACVTQNVRRSSYNNHESPPSVFSDVAVSAFSSVSSSETKRSRYLATNL